MTRKTRKTRSYADIRRERLTVPAVAAEYLNATRETSPENFLNALKNVAQARNMTSVAKEAGVQRETLYRSLSETGNPTLLTFESVLGVCGLEIVIRVRGAAEVIESDGGSQTENLPTDNDITSLITEKKCFDALFTLMNNAKTASDLVEGSSSSPIFSWTDLGGLQGNAATEN